jgi:N-acetylneuraminic acid mutarotase
LHEDELSLPFKHMIRGFPMKRFEITTRASAALGILLSVGGCAAGASGNAAVASPTDPAVDASAAEASGMKPSNAPLAVVPGDMMPVGLTTVGATALGDQLYILGGYGGTPHQYSKRDQSREFYRLDTKSHRWDKLASVGPIQSAVLVNDGKYVYRVGGMIAKNDPGQPEDMHSLADVGRFDPEKNTWQALTSMPEPRSSHQAVLYGSRLIVVGGWKLDGGTYDSEWHPTLASCDLAEAQCTWKVEPMPLATRAHGAAVYGDKLYVLGGLTPEGSTDDVHIYDLKAGTWSRGPSLPKDNMTIVAAVYREQLYANGADGNVYRLAPDGSAWSVAGTLAFPRMFHQLIEGPSGLLAVGGIPSAHRGARIRHIEQASLDAPPAGVVWTLDTQSAAKNRQGAFLLGQQLYVFGGNNSLEQHDFAPENFVSTARRLDLGTLEWKAAADFPVKRQSMQTAIGGTEEKPLGLVVGGFGFAGDRLGSQPEVYAYDVKADQWSASLAKMPIARSQFGLVEWEKAAWVIGGLNFEQNRKGDEFKLPTAVLRLDLEHPEAGFTDAGFNVGETRRAFAGGLLGDRFYLTGGLKDNFEPVIACEVLDLKTKTSSPMTCPSRHRLGGELVPLGNKLYLIGGSAPPDGGGERVPSTRIEAYDPATNQWTTLSDALPFEEPKQLQAFAYRDRLLLYTANRSTATVQVALVDPAALAAGSSQFVSVAVPASP